MWTKPIPTSKTVKTDQFSHPSNQNPFWLNAVVTSGAYGGFVSIWDQWWYIIASQMEVKPGPKKEEMETTLDTISENQSVI